MPVYELEESNYAGPIPDGTKVHAEVVSISTKTRKNREGEEYSRLLFKFVIQDPDSGWDTQNVYGETSTLFTTNPDCKLRNWAQEIMGVDELPAKFRLDTDVLVGLDCYVVVGSRDYEKDGEQKTANFIKDVQRTGNGSGGGSVDEEPF